MKRLCVCMGLASPLLWAAYELHAELPLAYGLLAAIGVVFEIGFAFAGGFLIFLGVCA